MRSFGEHRVPNKKIHILDGQQALDYLYRRGDYSDPRNSPRPRLVLLDLRLPKIDGLEVLKEIKTDETLRAIPIVILTTSGSQRDVATAYAHHANSYVVKPVDFEQFTRLMSDLGYYWLGWNRCIPLGLRCSSSVMEGHRVVVAPCRAGASAPSVRHRIHGPGY